MPLSLSKASKLAAIVSVCAAVLVVPSVKAAKWYIETTTDAHISKTVEARVEPVEASLQAHVNSPNHPTERELSELRAEVSATRTDVARAREDVAYIRGLLDRAVKKQVLTR